MADSLKRPHPVVIDLTGDDDDDEPTCPPPRSSQNPIVEAARSGQARTLTQLLRNFHGDVTEAVVAAAANGHFSCAGVFRYHFVDPWDDESHVTQEGLASLRLGVKFPAGNGHLAIVELFLGAMSYDAEIDEFALVLALFEAVKNGHLDIVEYVAEYIYPGFDKFDRIIKMAMALAISSGFPDVVAFLLTWENGTYDAGNVLEEAIAKEQHDVANKIYEIYPQMNRGRNLLVDMAARGRANAVKYLYDHGHNETGLIGEAMIHATANHCTGVVDFLHRAGRVSSGTDY